MNVPPLPCRDSGRAAPSHQTSQGAHSGGSGKGHGNSYWNAPGSIKAISDLLYGDFRQLCATLKFRDEMGNFTSSTACHCSSFISRVTERLGAESEMSVSLLGREVTGRA